MAVTAFLTVPSAHTTCHGHVAPVPDKVNPKSDMHEFSRQGAYVIDNSLVRIVAATPWELAGMRICL